MKVAIVSCLLAGGLVFGSAFSAADRNTPSPPAARPARPPKPPKPPKIHVQIDGLDEMIDEHIENALDAIGSAGMPPAVREKVSKRLDRVRKRVKSRVKGGNIDHDALAELGEEIGREMEEFGKEMEEWGEQFGKHMENKVGKLDIRVDIDADADHDGDRDDDHDDEDLDDADDDLDDAMKSLGQLKLAPAQRDQIKRLRAESEAKAAAARRELDRASEQLRKQLDNPATSEMDISRSIDAVTQQEAALRKARILAWVKARRVLDDAQRKQVERAVKRKGR